MKMQLAMKIRMWMAAACAAAAMACAAQVDGPWHGSVDLGGAVLPIVFNFEASGDGVAATLDSPLQGAKGIPATASFAGDTLRVEVESIGAKYVGVIAAGRIEGRLSQSGMTFPLTLEPGEYVPPRPQTPRQPYPYETKDVEFVNPADSTTLAGTLTLPTQWGMPMFKSFPAVVFVSGSGAQNRDEEIMGHRPFAVLADRLARNGIASLRYDDRGFGLSGGDRENATTATYAGDARAAVECLRSLSDRFGPIGVIGHSEGGTIAYMLAAEGDADFIVSLAGPALRGDSTLLLQNEALLRDIIDAETLAKYMAGLRIVFGYMVNGGGEQEMEQAVASLGLPEEMAQNLLAIVATRNPWTDFSLAYDPAEAISKIAVPVLAINGTLDRQVIAEPNLQAVESLLPPSTPRQTLAMPGLNHMLQTARTGMPAEYSMIDETISEDAISAIISWIKSLK